MRLGIDGDLGDLGLMEDSSSFGVAAQRAQAVESFLCVMLGLKA